MTAVCISCEDDGRQIELGITLAPSHQRRGYATESLASVIDYAFTRLEKHRITAVTDAENAAAAALFHRLGFRREGHFIENVWFKGRWGSEFAFALLRTEWEQRSALPRIASLTMHRVPHEDAEVHDG